MRSKRVNVKNVFFAPDIHIRESFNRISDDFGNIRKGYLAVYKCLNRNLVGGVKRYNCGLALAGRVERDFQSGKLLAVDCAEIKATHRREIESACARVVAFGIRQRKLNRYAHVGTA